MSRLATIARMLLAADADDRAPMAPIVRTPTQARIVACHDRSEWLLAGPAAALLGFMAVRVGLSLHHHLLLMILLVMTGYLIFGAMVGMLLGAIIRRADDVLDLEPYRLPEAADGDRVPAAEPTTDDWRAAA